MAKADQVEGFRASAIRLAISSLIGLVAGALILTPWIGILAYFVIGVGWILVVPFFLVALLVLFLFQKHIQKHLFGWCIFAPFAVTGCWLALEYSDYSSRGFSLAQYLVLRGVADRALIALACASASSVAFYYLSKASRLGR